MHSTRLLDRYLNHTDTERNMTVLLFRYHGDFFMRHYDEEIYKNGIKVVDMMCISQDL